jgi:hypothetical protein
MEILHAFGGLVLLLVWYASAAAFVKYGYDKGYGKGRHDVIKERGEDYIPPSKRLEKRRTYRR